MKKKEEETLEYRLKYEIAEELGLMENRKSRMGRTYCKRIWENRRSGKGQETSHRRKEIDLR